MPVEIADIAALIPHLQIHGELARFSVAEAGLLVSGPPGLKDAVVVEVPAHLQLLGGIVAVPHLGLELEILADLSGLRIHREVHLRRLLVHRLEYDTRRSGRIGDHRDKGIPLPDHRVVALQQQQFHGHLTYRNAVHLRLQPSPLHRDIADDLPLQLPFRDAQASPGDLHLVAAGHCLHVDQDTAGL